MFAPVAFAILALVAVPPQQPDEAAWGRYEWDHGSGPTSRYQFRYGATFPSGYFLEYGARSGSFYWLIFATAPGSAHFWDNGREAGSAYYWRNGYEAGSRHYWENGRGCLSGFGWRNGAPCSAAQVVVFQTLCIAEAVELPPCDAINARLDAWLERSSGLSSSDPTAAIVRMREALD
jgi:hypothetical protein